MKLLSYDITKLDFVSIKPRTEYDTIAKVIKDRICFYYNMDPTTTFCNEGNKVRKREKVKARQILAFLLKAYKCGALAEIGKLICPDNPFDHATVLHSIKTVSNLYQTDRKFYGEFNEIKQLVDSALSQKRFDPIEIKTIRTKDGFKFSKIVENEKVLESGVKILTVSLIYKEIIPSNEESDTTTVSDFVI